MKLFFYLVFFPYRVHLLASFFGILHFQKEILLTALNDAECQQKPGFFFVLLEQGKKDILLTFFFSYDVVFSIKSVNSVNVTTYMLHNNYYEYERRSVIPFPFAALKFYDAAYVRHSTSTILKSFQATNVAKRILFPPIFKKFSEATSNIEISCSMTIFYISQSLVLSFFMITAAGSK